MSVEYESERKKLEIDNRTAARQMEAAREQNWRLLEEKGDVEISIHHVKELSRQQQQQQQQPLSSTASSDTVTNFDLIHDLKDWNEILKDILEMEQALNEQDTVVQVYRTALDKDFLQILKSQNQSSSSSLLSSKNESDKNIPLDHTEHGSAILSVWKQFNSNFKAMEVEVEKWMTFQDVLFNAVTHFVNVVQSITSSYKSLHGIENHTDDENKENSSSSLINEIGALDIKRGLELILKQVLGMQKKFLDNIYHSRLKVIDFDNIGNELMRILRYYEKRISDDFKNDEIVNKSTTSSNTDGESKSGIGMNVETLLKSMKKCCNDLNDRIKMSSIVPRNGNVPSSRNSFLYKNVNNDEIIDNYEVEYSIGMIEKSNTGIDQDQDISIHNNINKIDSDYFWKCPANVCVDNIKAYKNSSTNSGAFLEITLPNPQIVTQLIIQGGITSVSQPSTKSSSDIQPSDSLSIISSSDVVLDCGLTLNDCNGEVEITVKAIGEVISWPILLKKTPPEKFLNRPPIRFLFDLITYCAKENVGCFPINIESADWVEVSASKQTKIDFMEKVSPTFNN